MTLKPAFAAALLAAASSVAHADNFTRLPSFSAKSPALGLDLDLTVTPRGYVVAKVNGIMEVSSCARNAEAVTPVVNNILDTFSSRQNQPESMLLGLSVVMRAAQFSVEQCQKTSRPMPAALYKKSSETVNRGVEKIDGALRGLRATPV